MAQQILLYRCVEDACAKLREVPIVPGKRELNQFCACGEDMAPLREATFDCTSCGAYDDRTHAPQVERRYFAGAYAGRLCKACFREQWGNGNEDIDETLEGEPDCFGRALS